MNALNEKNKLGFWLYLMTDCVLFASLFATYAVLRNNTFGGPSGAELFSLPFVLVETVILLTSSFVSGLLLLAAQAGNKKMALWWLASVIILGLSFLGMELYEFSNLIHEGNSWQRSGFLSAFFTLVGTHGLHILFGLVWAVLLFYLLAKKGLTNGVIKRLSLFGLFWHFLDIIWIFIFTFVYMIGAI